MKNILAAISRMWNPTPALIVLVLLISNYAKAVTNIGGIINTYTPVTAISNACACPTTNCASITVVSATGFAVNDIVLLIQMKGARADSSNTPTHGNILNLYDAGNYEFDTINSIAGNVISIRIPLKNTYFTSSNPTDSAYVQLIKVPVYTGDVNVTSTLTPQAWNATTRTGGVLVFWLTGILTLQANISADGYGFAAAKYLKIPISCSLDTNFYYESTGWNYSACTTCGYNYDDSPTRYADQAAYGGCAAPCPTNRMDAADLKEAGFRGEGVAANTFKKTFANGNVALFNTGKGKWGNGGGGGANHNAGGGGGANYGAGGWGGNAFNIIGGGSGCTSGTLTVRRGYGGAALTPTAIKVFMGGGGGEGHDDGGQGTTGANGGGIIMIKAASVTNGASWTITANGSSVAGVAIGDGCGGGGAGGSILLDVSGSYSNAVTIQAKGGKGGDQNNNTCHGTGGGGGGGVIWFSTAGGSIPANVTTSTTGGANGVQVAATIDCGDVNWGATAGSAGGVLLGPASGATVFLNMNSCASALPIELVSFRADVEGEKVVLHWTTESEKDNDYFSVEKSEDGKQFSEVARVEGQEQSSETRNYSATDEHPFFGSSYYRLKQVDINGRSKNSPVVEVSINKPVELSLYPNPSYNYFTVSFEGVKNFNMVMTSITGNNFYELGNIVGETKINTQQYPKGIYYVKVYSGKTMMVKKISIM